MNFFNLLLIFAICCVSSVLMAAENYEDYIKTDSGLLYKITEPGNGELPHKGDTVVLHYTGKLENGSKFDSSYDRNQPFSFELGAGKVIRGWDEGVALLHKGDKATFVIPPELGYGSRAMSRIPANSTLIFEVELLDIKPAPKIDAYDITGLKMHTTDSGLQYYIIAQGKGDSPGQGSVVKVHYSGYLQKDNSLFDSSLKRNQPFEFSLGIDPVIQGWTEGIALMKIGAKYRFVIPPELGYGNRSVGPIPAGSTLIFDVELLDFN